MMLTKNRLIILIMFFLPFISIAQCDKWKEKITIITFSNDTIQNAYLKNVEYFCTINPVLYFRVKKDGNCINKKILTKNINEIKIGDDRFLNKINLSNNYHKFIKLISGGEIKYYSGICLESYVPVFRKYKKDELIQFDNGLDVLWKKTYHYIEIDNELFAIKDKKKKFVKQMIKLFGECPDINRNIKSGIYTINDINLIVEVYLKWKKNRKG